MKKTSDLRYRTAKCQFQLIACRTSSVLEFPPVLSAEAHIHRAIKAEKSRYTLYHINGQDDRITNTLSG